MLLVVVLGGCQGLGDGHVFQGAQHSVNNILTDRDAQREVNQAISYARSGEHSLAIPRLIHAISTYPETKTTTEARFWLGHSYFEIDYQREAQTVLRDYLRLAPAGKYAAQARAHLEELTVRQRASMAEASALDLRIAELADKVKAAPDLTQHKVELADLLWQRGDYNDAAKLYEHLLDKNRELADQPPIADRVKRQSDGTYVVLTPEQSRVRDARANPLVVSNTHGFPSGRDRWTQVYQYYVVSGQVLNRSDRPLDGVEAVVTIYGFGTMVYDTHTVHFGTLAPGQSRPFSVRFGKFDTVNNIQRFEVIATYEPEQMR